MRGTNRERPRIITLASMSLSSVIVVLLAFVGVVRHRTDQMITALYELFFVVRSRLGDDMRHRRNAETGSTAQPGMRGVAG